MTAAQAAEAIINFIASFVTTFAVVGPIVIGVGMALVIAFLRNHD